ncbi:hypothetical protein Tco_1321674, partial [Tanacetum coccineum]
LVPCSRMKSGFLSSRGRGVKQKGGSNARKTAMTSSKDVEGVSSMISSDQPLVGQFTSFSDAYGSPSPFTLEEILRDIERQIYEGKLMLMGDDGKPLKPSRLTRDDPSSQEELVGHSEVGYYSPSTVHWSYYSPVTVHRKKTLLFFELLFMASDGNDQDAEYAISKLLQIGTVKDYQREFEMLIKRVTIPESLLKSFYISELKLDLQCLLLKSNPKTLDKAFSLAREAETRFANLDIWEFLRSNPSTLGEDFFKARITKARFEIITKEDKEHIIEKKIDVILPLQGEFASPKAKGSLNADGFIDVEEVVGGGEKLGIGEDDDLGDVSGYSRG